MRGRARQVRGYLLRRFIKVWKFKYSAIDLIACLGKGLSKYDEPFAVAIVDSVLEEIRVGVEVSAPGGASPGGERRKADSARLTISMVALAARADG